MTSAVKLERIRLKAFRGATREVLIDFDPYKQITMVFGENGTGKSTIVDALTVLCEQSLGSLDDRAGAKEERYLVSAGCKKSDLLIEVKAIGGVWTATLAGNKISVTPKNGYPHLKVLRRPQLSRFIDAAPKEKFEELKQFISTPGVEASEGTLREAERASAARVEHLTRGLDLARGQLDTLWEKEGRKVTDARAWAQTIVQQDVAALRTQNDSIEKLERAAANLSDVIKTGRAALTQMTKSRTEWQSAADLQKQEEGKIAGQSSNLLRLLSEALDYVGKQPSLKACPVCDQPVDHVSLHADLQNKIAGFSALSEAVAASSGAKKALDTAEARLADSLRSTKDALDGLLKCKAGSLTPAELVPEPDENDVSAVSDTTLSADERLSSAEIVANAMNIAATQWDARMEENTKVVNLHNAVSLQLRQLQDNEAELVKADALSRRLARCREVLEESRKAFVKDILAEISGEVVALYGRLHPSEQLGNITLSLHDRYQGSLLLKGEFVGEKNVPPQAYFSESHLDTLGICIFLAFTKRFSPPNTFVVLDDVLTSVDSAHLDRFIDLLDSEAASFGHVFITTHYRPWRERYRTHQAASSKLHFIELKEWSPGNGLLPDTCKPAIHELMDWLDPRNFDRQIVASKGGILLESILDHLSLLYRASMPRKSSQDYTLGEYLDGFSKKDRALLKVEQLDAAGITTKTVVLGSLLDSLDAMTWIRNQVGCHFSVAGQLVADKDVRTFAERVLELGTALMCCEGGDFPKHNRSGSYFESRRKRCRLYPLQMP